MKGLEGKVALVSGGKNAGARDPRRRATRWLFVVALFELAGCRHVRPWERSKLAHPSMTTTSLDGPAADHMHGVQEGAAGGGDAPESGCGCN